MSAKLKFLSAILIFSTIGLFVRALDLPMPIIALIRGVVGTLFLLVVFLAGKNHFSPQMIKQNLIPLLLSGIALGADWIFIFEAYHYTSISIATVTYYLAPAILVIASAALLKERLSPLKITCIALALVGIVLVTGITSGTGLAGLSLKGVGFGLLAAVCYAGLTLGNKFIKGLPSLESTLIQLAIGSLVVLPYALLSTDLTSLSFSGKDIILLATLGIVHNGFAFWLYFSAVPQLKSQTIAVLGYIEPVLAVILSALLLHEQMLAVQILGTVLVLGSTLIGQLNLRQRRKEAYQ